MDRDNKGLSGSSNDQLSQWRSLYHTEVKAVVNGE
jgi:hypothetical protein